jgi:outer membrane autotransporter protein
MLDSTANGRSNPAGAGALGFASSEQAQAPAQAPDAALDYAAVSKAPRSATFEQRWSAWGSAFGSGIKASGDPSVGSADVTAMTYGMGGGMDYRISPDTVLGFAVAGGATSWSLAQGLGSGRSDVFQAGVYGTTHFGPAYLATALSIANHWMTTDRFAFAGDHLQAAFDAQSYGGRVEAGYRYAMATAAVTPYVAGTIQRFSTPSYSETDAVGGGFGLDYSAAAATEIRGEVGARIDTLVGISDTTSLILHARGAWAYDKISDPGLVAMFTAALLPGGLPGSGVGFTVNGAKLPSSLALASAGAELRFSNNWSLLTNFHGEFGSGSQSYSGNGTVRYSW